jgi:hypothetical protein
VSAVTGAGEFAGLGDAGLLQVAAMYRRQQFAFPSGSLQAAQARSVADKALGEFARRELERIMRELAAVPGGPS